MHLIVTLFSLISATFVVGLHRINIKLWPGGIVYYDADPRLTDSMRAAIRYSVNYLSTVSCVKWVQRLPWLDNVDYVSFQFERDDPRRPVCLATIEYQGGRQRVRVGEWCFKVREPWQQRHIMVHEMMHVIGFHHEHQRPDRNCYITIGDPYNYHPQYLKQLDYEFVDDFPYDYGSMMHYWGLPHSNMTALNKSITRLGRYNEYLDLFDKKKIRSVYCGEPSYCEIQANLQKCQEIWEYKKQTNCSKWSGWLHPLPS